MGTNGARGRRPALSAAGLAAVAAVVTGVTVGVRVIAADPVVVGVGWESVPADHADTVLLSRRAAWRLAAWRR
jgi:hypothetical protein